LRAIGIDLGGTNLRASLVTEGGEVLERRRTPVSDVHDGDGIVDAIAALAKETAAGSSPGAIGIGAAGPLDHTTGTMYRPPNLPGLKGMDLAHRIEDRTGLPTYLENDANAAVLGEYRAGAGRMEIVFLGLTLGTGVGGGIVLRGELFRGHGGTAGELGHMVVDPSGPPCLCGGRGHLEGLASAHATAARFREGVLSEKARLPSDFGKDPGEIEALDVFRLAEAGHRYAAEVLAESGKWLGVGIATLQGVFAPEAVILLGGLAGAFPYFRSALWDAFHTWSMTPPGEAPRIAPGELGDDAGVVGAAILALERHRAKS
jgi:glucokinase